MRHTTLALESLQRSSQIGLPPSRTVPSNSLGPPIKEIKAGLVVVVRAVVVVVAVVVGFRPPSA